MAVEMFFFSCVSWLLAHVFCCVLSTHQSTHRAESLEMLLLSSCIRTWTRHLNCWWCPLCHAWWILAISTLGLVCLDGVRSRQLMQAGWLSTPSGRRTLSVCILCFILGSVSPFLFLLHHLALSRFPSLFLCQTPPDQSLGGCHGYQQSVAAAVAAARVYFVVSWGEFKSCPFLESTQPNLTITHYPDLWNQMCKICAIIELQVYLHTKK